DDELGLVEDRRRLGEGASRGYEPAEPVAPGLVARRDGHHRPARSMQRGAECRPHRASPDDPDQWRLPRLRVAMGVGVARLLGAVVRMPGRVEIDASLPQVVERGRIRCTPRPPRRRLAPGLHAVPGYPSTCRVYPAEAFP